GVGILKEIVKRGAVHGTLTSYDEIKDQAARLCPHCQKGKATHSNFKESQEDYSDATPLQYMAIDIKGPFRVSSFKDQFRYASIISFKRSKWLIVNFGKFKTDVYNHIEDAVQWVKMRGDKVKVIQS